MNLFQALAHVGQGAAISAATHQMKTDPVLKRKNAAKARAMAEKCTPCAAGAYVQQLRDAFSPKK